MTLARIAADGELPVLGSAGAEDIPFLAGVFVGLSILRLHCSSLCNSVYK